MRFTDFFQGEELPETLTIQEEIEYLKLVAAGDIEAKKKLCEHNLRLVLHIVKKFNGSGVDLDDLVGIGTCGLLKAINTYDIKREIRLASYASKCIENEILIHLRKKYLKYEEASLDNAVSTEKDNMTFKDALFDLDDSIEQIIEQDELISEIIDSLSALDDKEKKIIALRYGLGNGGETMTQNAVGKIMNFSRSYISRLEKKALDKLADFLSEKYGYNLNDRLEKTRTVRENVIVKSKLGGNKNSDNYNSAIVENKMLGKEKKKAGIGDDIFEIFNSYSEAMIIEAVSLLEPMERTIMELKYGLNDSVKILTEEIANKFNISADDVSRIIIYSKNRLKKILLEMKKCSRVVSNKNDDNNTKNKKMIKK